jgi:hypothetical protein
MDYAGFKLYSIVLRQRVVDSGPDMTQGLRWRLGIRRAQLEDVLATGHAMAHKAFHYARKPVKNPAFLKRGRRVVELMRGPEPTPLERALNGHRIEGAKGTCAHCGMPIFAPYCFNCFTPTWNHWCKDCKDNTTVEEAPSCAY